MLKLFKKFFSTASTIKKAIDNGAVIVDVRTPDEYNAGHIESSRNIPLDKIKSSITLIKSFHKPIILVCRSGTRSQIAKQLLNGAGIETYNGGPWTHLKKIVE